MIYYMVHMHMMKKNTTKQAKQATNQNNLLFATNEKEGRRKKRREDQSFSDHVRFVKLVQLRAVSDDDEHGGTGMVQNEL